MAINSHVVKINGFIKTKAGISVKASLRCVRKCFFLSHIIDLFCYYHRLDIFHSKYSVRTNNYNHFSSHYKQSKVCRKLKVVEHFGLIWPSLSHIMDILEN